MSKGPRIPVLLGSAYAIQVIRLVLTDSSADLEALAMARIVCDSDRDDETFSSTPDITSFSDGGVDTGKATEVPVAIKL